MQIFVNQAETKLRATSWSHELRPLSRKKREKAQRRRPNAVVQALRGAAIEHTN